jgi:polyhydroxyalkanoate synthesis repressor PhaR
VEKDRVIKKYPNRRLYDAAVSAYVTLEDIRRLVKEGVKFKVVDAKTEEDITRSILLQVILELEERGKPIFSQGMLEQIIRSYGDAMQGFMTAYLEESLAVFLKQQTQMREQMASLLETAPMSVYSGLAQQNLRLWQSMQDAFLKTYGLGDAPGADGKDKSPG